MKVQGRERIAFNFKDVFKSFFSNGVVEAEDEEVEQEVKKIIEQQDNKFIEKLVKSAESTGKTVGGKRNERINLEKAKTKQTEVSSVEDKKREDDRERE